MANTEWLGGSSVSELGPCNAYFDTATGGSNLDLGTFDSFMIKMAITKTPLKEAQYGTSPANQAVTGADCTLEFGMTRSSLERMDAVIPGFVLNKNTANTILGFSFGTAIGQLDSNTWKQVKIVKIVNGSESTAANDTIYVWRAAPTGTADLTFDAATQRIVKITMQCYRDETQLNVEGAATFWGSGTI